MKFFVDKRRREQRGVNTHDRNAVEHQPASRQRRAAFTRVSKTREFIEVELAFPVPPSPTRTSLKVGTSAMMKVCVGETPKEEKRK